MIASLAWSVAALAEDLPLEAPSVETEGEEPEDEEPEDEEPEDEQQAPPEPPPLLTRSLVVSTGLIAVRQAARHVVTPPLSGALAVRHERGLMWGVEASTWRRDIRSDVYRHHKFAVTVAGTLGAGLCTPWFAVDLSGGPALAFESGAVSGDGAESYRFNEGSAGLRLRNGFELRFVGPVVARAQLGALVRGVARWDFDVSAGLGATW